MLCGGDSALSVRHFQSLLSPGLAALSSSSGLGANKAKARRVLDQRASIVIGSQARTRTWDMLVNSEPLYQLSYLGINFDEIPIYKKPSFLLRNAYA